MNKRALLTGLETTGRDQGGSDRLDERVCDMVMTVLMAHTKGEKFDPRFLNARPVRTSCDMRRGKSDEFGGTVVFDLSDDGTAMRVIEGLMKEHAWQALLHQFVLYRL